MAFVPTPNVVEVEIRATFDNQKIENRFMVDALTAVDPGIVQEITTSVYNWATTTYFINLPAAVQLREVVGTDLTVADGAQYTKVPTSPTFGSLNSDPMPNESTFCVSLRSASRGRSARGRAYVLGLIKGEVSGNIFNSVRASAFVGAFNSLISTLDASGWALVVVSYISNGEPRPGGPVYYTLTAASYSDLYVDSQRRRKPGVGS